MTHLCDIPLSRARSDMPWGFRMHGGADFALPLTVQRVRSGSFSECNGLRPGDIIVRVNGIDVTNHKHKDAQQAIIGAGNQFTMTVKRATTPQQQIYACSSHVNPMSRQQQQQPKQFAASQTIGRNSSSSALTTTPDGRFDVTGHNNSTNGGKTRSTTETAAIRRATSPAAMPSAAAVNSVESFTCAVCKTPLRHLGWFGCTSQQIGNNIYCNTHAPMPTTESLPSASAPLTPHRVATAVAGSSLSPTQLSKDALRNQQQNQLNYQSHQSSFVTVDDTRRGFIEGPMAHHSNNGASTVASLQPNGNNNYVNTNVEQSDVRSKPLLVSQCVSVPQRGRGELRPANSLNRRPLCGACGEQIRGPFIMALNKTWCPDHFVCSQEMCRASLQDMGFVEEAELLYCEHCFCTYFAPECDKCGNKIPAGCLKALNRSFHPECFTCSYCNKMFANSPFYMEDGLPYCQTDWNDLFTTKCAACNFPIDAGDKWVEALDNNFHSQCFNCTLCKRNLEGQKYFVKAGKPFCTSHARTAATFS